MNKALRHRLPSVYLCLRIAVFLCLCGLVWRAPRALAETLKKTKAPAVIDDSGNAPDQGGVEDLEPDTSGDYAPPAGSHYGAPEDLQPDETPAPAKPDESAKPERVTKPVPSKPESEPEPQATGRLVTSPDGGQKKPDYVLEPDAEPAAKPPPGSDELESTRKPKPVEGGPDIAPAASGPEDTAPEPLTSDTGAPPASAAQPATPATDAQTPAPPAATQTNPIPPEIPTTPVSSSSTESVPPATETTPILPATATAPARATDTQPVPPATDTAPLPAPVDTTSTPEPDKSDNPTSPTIGPIVITGFTELISQNVSVSSGSEYNMLSQNGLLYFDKFRQRTRIFLDGKLDDGTRIDGEFVEMPYLDRVFTLNAENENYIAHIGDTPAVFESGDMTTFRKQIRGLDLLYKTGNTRMNLLFSKQKSKTQTETFQGRNIRGPYALRNTGLVQNTEVVRVNGQVLPRTAYTIDYFLGQITFNQVMDPGDAVEVHYESQVWLDLRTGNLFGVSVASDFMDSKATLGASFLREKTDVLPQAKVFSASRTAQKQDLLVAGTGAYVFNLQQGILEKNHELITATASATDTFYLDRGVDYVIDYASGVVTFASASADFSALPGSATLTVVFNYYEQGYLQWVQDEVLSGDGEIEYILSYERVYGGTEYVALYEYDTFVRRLTAGLDYEINEGNNSIVFLDANAMPSGSFGRTVHVSYEIVPEMDRVTTEDTARRTVQSLFGNVEFGNFKVSGEVAQSSSDLRLKTVPVIEELVGTVTWATQSVFLLQHEAQYNSVEIYFDDVTAPSARQSSGSDYVLDTDPGTGLTRIQFKRDIPLGTTIIANYKYQPDADYLRSRDGKAGRVVTEYKEGGTSFRGEFMRKSPQFAPLSAYNDLENERLFASLGLANIHNFSLNLDYAHQSTNQDLTSSRKTAFDSLKTRLGYKFAKGHTVAYSIEAYDRRDNLAAHVTDTTLAGQRVDATFIVNQAMTTTASYETRTLNDDTDRTSDRDVKRGSIGVTYAPSTRTRLGLTLGDSALNSTPPPGSALAPFSIKTFLTQLTASYLPSENLSLNVNLNTQNIDDTREDAAGGKLDSIRADLFGKGSPSGSLGAVKDYLVSFYRQDRPDPVFGDSRTDVATLRLTLRAGAQVQVTPSFVATKSQIGTGSNSRDNATGVRVDYRAGATQGWRAAANYSTSARRGVNVSSSDPSNASAYNSHLNQWSLYLDFMPGSAWIWNGIYQNSSASGTGSQARTSYTSKLSYLMNDKSTLRFVYNLDQNAGTTGDRTSLELGAATRLDRNMDLDVEYKQQQQTHSGDSDYEGTLFNLKLRINF